MSLQLCIVALTIILFGLQLVVVALQLFLFAVELDFPRQAFIHLDLHFFAAFITSTHTRATTTGHTCTS